MLLVGLIIMGLALGSFVNAWVWRLRMQQQSKKSQKRLYSVVHGRSMCPNCHHRLSALDLIPIASWIFLKGKCRYCHQAINWQYPVVEAALAVLLLISYLFWPYAWDIEGQFRFVLWIVSLTVLLALFIYDLKWMILPDKLNAVFFGLSLVQVLGIAVLFDGGFASIIRAAVAILPLGGFFYLLFQFSDGKLIGGGDVKLGFGLGLIAGTLPLALLILFVASLIGTAVSIALMIVGSASAKSKVPFGPFLITAAVIVQIFGRSLLEWYLGLVV